MMVWRSGPDGQFDYVNSTWLAFTGRKFEEEIGQGWLQAVHPEDREGCLSMLLENVQKRTAWGKEFRLRRHDGVFIFNHELEPIRI